MLVILLLVFWQSLKYLPWLQTFQTSSIDHGPSASGEINPVVITVYYEALCPDSKSFFLKHLLPTVDKAARLISVSLVPYGKAKTNEDNFGNLSFSCQHGPTECQANKIHACAIMLLPETKLQVKYISCMISNNIYPHQIGERCARELSINWDSILECSQSKKGDMLLKRHGDKTLAVRPKITFIPTVHLDELIGNQAAILKDLFKEVCARFKRLPVECLPLADQHSS